MATKKRSVQQEGSGAWARPTFLIVVQAQVSGLGTAESGACACPGPEDS